MMSTDDVLRVHKGQNEHCPLCRFLVGASSSPEELVWVSASPRDLGHHVIYPWDLSVLIHNCWWIQDTTLDIHALQQQYMVNLYLLGQVASAGAQAVPDSVLAACNAALCIGEMLSSSNEELRKATSFLASRWMTYLDG